ncbi:phosphatase PAP2 family protein [Providencia stuartii]|nr:phosphatase PAP2 family protein [Providencia stuartii]MTB80934.1 phosphatase PAP2 family protein [Providencia stuartii]
MLKTHYLHLFNRLFAIQLFIIWLLGCIGVFGSDLTETLWPSVLTGGIFWILLVACSKLPKWQSPRFYWVGLLQLIACWSIFPLFKAIRIHFYSWSADHLLYTIDSYLWLNKSLPEHMIALQAPWFSELIAFCYFSFYFLVIGSALFFFLQRKKNTSEHYFLGLMLMYFFGFIGYFILPAVGPYGAFPTLFTYPVHNGAITLFLTDMVEKGITGMDVFPSLHTGITLYIVGFLFKIGYRKIAWCLTPLAAGLIVATVYLHYHYGIDVIVGALLALLVLHFLFKKKKVENGTHL